VRLFRWRRSIEERLDALEAEAEPRIWELPPANSINLVELPTLPDYSVSWWAMDDEGEAEGWNPTGYV